MSDTTTVGRDVATLLTREVEGFKREPIPKLEVYRKGVDEPLLHPHDPNIVAIASDCALDTKLPVLDLNHPEKIAEFILQHVGLHVHSVEPQTGRKAI